MAIVGNLGKALFQVSAGKIVTYQRMSRRKSATFAEHAVLDAKGRLQWTGNKLASMNLSIKLDANWCDPRAELDRLGAMLDEHEPIYLVLGSYNYGKVVIEEMRESIKRTDGKGDPVIATANLRLKEYN